MQSDNYYGYLDDHFIHIYLECSSSKTIVAAAERNSIMSSHMLKAFYSTRVRSVFLS